MIIPSYQTSSRHHLDLYLDSSNHICPIHIYSNCNCATWVEYEFITNQDSILLMWCCYIPYHSMCLYTMLINEPFKLCSHMSIIHTKSHAYLNLLTCVELFISKWVNWVLQYFKNLCSVSKGNRCYLRIKVVILIQIVLLLHYSTPMWSNSHEPF
jgi:hypothetical protein